MDGPDGTADDEARKEAIMARLADPEVYSDPARVQAVQAEADELDAQITAGFEEWEQLNERLADLETN